MHDTSQKAYFEKEHITSQCISIKKNILHLGQYHG